MTKDWLTSNELAGLHGLPKNKRSINRLAAKQGWQSRVITVRGGTANEYHITSLPLETQAALLKASQPTVTKTPIKQALNDAKFSYDSNELWQHYDKKPQK
jgi:hypothetical protein